MSSQHQSWGINPPTSAQQSGFQTKLGESPAISNRDTSWAASADVSRAASANQLHASPRKKGLVREQLTSWKMFLKRMSMTHWALLSLSCAGALTGFPASSILTRLYYVDGGTSKWLVSWLAPAGWPITAGILLGFCLMQGEYPTPLTWELTISYAVLGFLSAADNLMFAYAYAYLPASTAALLASSSLTFTAILAYFLVGQKFNSSIVNAVVVMTTASVILGLDSNSDRPFGVSSQQYAVGFVLTIVASAVHGLIFALSELLFIKLLGRKSFRVVLEAQTATSVCATICTTIGILIAGDFQKVHKEAQTFRHGPSAYYQVFVWSAISCQVGVLGCVGCLYLASTLLAGVLNAGRAPTTSIVAVICFNDPMGGFKILAILLTLWSFGSYIWGTYQQQKRLDKRQELCSLPTSCPAAPLRIVPRPD